MGKRRTRRLYLAAADAYQAGVLYAAGAHHNPPAVTSRALYDILWAVYQQGHERSRTHDAYRSRCGSAC